MQDATGGISFYDNFVTESGISIGDYIQLTAWVGFYNGLTELVDAPGTGANPTIVIMSSGNPVTPAVVTIPQVDENVEGQIIRVNGGHFVETGTFTSGSFHLVAGTDTLIIYIDSATDIPTNAIPAGMVDVIGVVGQYDPSSPYFSGYQLQPRMYADIIPGAGIPPVSDLQIQVGGGNVTLTWSDVVGAADYIVYYADSSTGPWTVLAASTGGSTSYTHVGGAAIPALKRFYYVTATD